MRIARFVVLFSTLAVSTLSVPIVAAGDDHSHPSNASSTLVEKARRATEAFLDVHNASQGGYEPILGCVSGPQEGAMGVHFLNGQFFMDGVLNADEPEALIYEYQNGIARLVGVEYIVLAAQWHQTHAPQDVPVLEGQLLQFNDSPNRFGLPPFYELHVWAWRDNPHGTFVDWNPRVSCDGQ